MKLAHWIENSDLSFQLQLTEDDSYISKLYSTIAIDATAETAEKNGYLSFAEINDKLKNFTVGDAASIAALCFACGVVHESRYSESATGAGWKQDFFIRSGMAGFSEVSSSTNPYFYASGSSDVVSGAVFEVLINEILAGRPVAFDSNQLNHALVLDGYDAETDEFHINYGWGGKSDGWYSRTKLNEMKCRFYVDIMPEYEYDGSPILVTNSAAYGIGTLLRGMEQLNGFAKAAELTIQTDGISLARCCWSFEKEITINNFNADIISSGYLIHNTKSLMIKGLSGTMEGVEKVFCSDEDIKITDFSGSLIGKSDEYSVSVLSGKNIFLQNYSGICIAAGCKNRGVYVVKAKEKTAILMNGGKMFSSNSIDEAQIAAVKENLSIYGANGVERARSLDAYADGYAIQTENCDNTVFAKNYSVIQGSFLFGDGNDTLSALGGSRIYAKYIWNADCLNIDSTSTISGRFELQNSLTVNMIITGETSRQAMLQLQEQDVYYFSYYYLKNKTFNIDLRAAADGEYVLISAQESARVEQGLNLLSAKIYTGDKYVTLKCGESAEGLSLKYENDQLILTLDGYSDEHAQALIFNREKLLSVTQTVSSQTFSADENSDSLRLTCGGTADHITVGAGGDLSISDNGEAIDTLVTAYGFLAVNNGGCAVNTTVKENGILNLGCSSVHKGSLNMEKNSIVRAEDSAVIDFTVSGFSGENYEGINDITLIAGNPRYTLTVSADQKIGKYVLAGNASGFNSSIAVNGLSAECCLTVNSVFSDEDGKNYSLAMSQEDELVLYICTDTEDVEPPFICLTGDNETVLQSTLLTADTEPDTVIYYSTDNENWIKYTDAITVTENAIYYFKATDAAGNTGRVQKEFCNIDSLPPDIPYGISAAVDGMEVVLSWKKSADHGRAGLTGYKIAYRMDSGDWTEMIATSARVVLKDMPCGVYELKICAFDAVGNISEYSEIYQFSVSGEYNRIVNAETIAIDGSALFTGQAAGNGGAIYNTAGGTMSLETADFFENSANCGGAVYNSGNMMIYSASFQKNSARDQDIIFYGHDGGAIYNGGTMSLETADFSENSANCGGAVYNSGNMMIYSASFQKNSAKDYGGAIYNSGSMTVSSGIFTENSNQCIYNQGSMEFSSASFRGNIRGAIYNVGTMSLGTTDFSENSANNGGAIYNGGTIRLNSASFQKNLAGQQGTGGAIFNAIGGTMTLESADLFCNSAFHGGAVYNAGSMMLAANFNGNTAGFFGGAVYNNGNMILSSSVFSGNSALYRGGVRLPPILDNFSVGYWWQHTYDTTVF